MDKGIEGLEEVKDIQIEALGKGAIGELARAGFQGASLGEAVGVIGKMKKQGCTVFLSFTANMVASGLRGVIVELCKKGFVDAVVTTAGSIDHDIIKSYAPYYLGKFGADDAELHSRGVNRLGNIFIPNSRYELLEEKVQKWLREIYEEKRKELSEDAEGNKEGLKVTSPSELSKFFGERVDGEGKEGSFLYWCAKKGIPVFCPGVTDGAIGLQMYLFKQDKGDFVVDVTGDMREIADVVLNAEKTGGIILGGGISKHHVIGANLLREGLDYAVYVTTAQEYDGSLSGASMKEAKSWGKVKEKGKVANVYGDAVVVFPLIVSGLRERGIL